MPASSAVADSKPHPHPVLPPEREGQADKDISIDPWHFLTFLRIVDGIDQKIEQLCAKAFVHIDFIEGWLAWFKSTHPEYFKKWWDTYERLNALGEEGKTDPEAQKAFNTLLRIYRDGSLWCIQTYVGWKKDQEAAARAAAAVSGNQEKMSLG